MQRNNKKERKLYQVKKETKPSKEKKETKLYQAKKEEKI